MVFLYDVIYLYVIGVNKIFVEGKSVKDGKVVMKNIYGYVYFSKRSIWGDIF